MLFILLDNAKVADFKYILRLHMPTQVQFMYNFPQ